MNIQDDKTALQLFKLFQQLLNAPMQDCMKDMSEQLIQLSQKGVQFDTKQQQLLNSCESSKQLLDNLNAKNDLLESASKANQTLANQHYDEHITQPMIRSLFPVLDLIIDVQRHQDSSSQTTELLEAIWSQLEQFLAIYDIHIISHNSNEEFNPQTAKPIKLITTDDKTLDNLIAESLRVGFSCGPTKILRFETVSLFKYEPKEFETKKLAERTESC